MPRTMLFTGKRKIKGTLKLKFLAFLSFWLLVIPWSQVFAQGSITGTVENSDTSTPADSEVTFWGFLDDTDEEIRTELSDGAGYQNGYWWDDFQNYLTEAPGNPYDYLFSNLVNGEFYHLEGLIPNNSYQEENIVLASASNPSKPTGVKARVTSTSRVVVSWNKVAGITYHVYRRYTSSNGSLFRLDDPSGSLTNPGVSDSFFVDTTVDGVSSFTYMVVGEDASGNYTPHSDEASANSSAPIAPMLTKISPNTGPTVGGTFVIIKGRNFDEDGMRVTIGADTATNVVVISPFELTCLTPPGSAGPANVRITNLASGLSSLILVGGFTYYVNTPPIADAGPDQSGIIAGTLVTLDGSDSYDTDGDSLGYHWSQISGPSVVLSDSNIVYPTFTPDTGGTYYFQLYVDDAIDYSQPDTVMIAVENQAPVLDSIGAKMVDEGQTLEFRVAATDPDGDSITLTAVDVPVNASFVDSGDGAGSFTFTPDFTQADTYYVTFIATDTTGLSDSEEVEIVVNDINRVPVSDAGSDQLNIDAGTLVTLDGSGSYDPDGDSVGYHWSQVSGPSVTLSDTNAVDPSFTPTVKGSYEFELLVDDGALVSFPDTVLVSVNNQSPVADAGSDQLNIDAGTLVTLDGSGSYDPDGDSVGYHWSQVSGPSVTLSDSNAVDPSFTPTIKGNYEFELLVDDGALSSSPDTVLVSVDNQAPVLASIGSRVVDEGQVLEFRVSATDADGDSIILSAEDIPDNGSFVDSGNGAGSFSFSPDYTQADTYYVTFIASDDDLADSEVVEIVVNDVNHAPVLDSIGSKTVMEGDTLEFRIHATDVNLDSIILDTLDVPLNAVFVDSGNGSGSFIFTPDFTQADTYYVTFIATDTVGAADSEVVKIVVTEFGNHAPELDSIGPKTVMEVDTLEFRIHATDLDLDSIILSAEDLPTNSIFVDSGNGSGSFTFTPDYDQAEIYNVTFIAWDGSLADSEIVSITVNNVNREPVLDSIGPRSVIEGGHMAFLVTASDPDDDSLVLSAENVPTNAIFTDSGNGTGSFEFDPDYTQQGVYYVTFKASDLDSADSEVVKITVIDAGNQAPVLDSIGPKTVAEAETLKFRVHATDPDGDIPALFVRNNPANSTFVDSGNGAGTFTFAPNYEQADTYMVTFVATDGELQDSELVEITVTETNRAPVLDSIGPKMVDEGQTLEFRTSATDADGDSIIITADSIPDNATFVDSGNGSGSFTFNPDYTQAGTYTVTFVAWDGTLADSEAVQITVNEVGNQAPELDSTGPKTVMEGDTLEFRIHATDADLDSIILDTLDVPLNAVFVDSGNGAGSFTFTPDFTQADTYYVTFIATDTLGAADSEVVEIVVNNVNQSPVLDSIGPKTVVEGDTLEFRIHATDSDLDSIILSAENQPINSVFMDSGNGSGSFTFTPDFTQADTYYVSFIATDVGGAADSEVVEIVVTEFGNHAPELDSIGSKTVVEGNTLEFRLHAADVDLDSIILDTLDVPLNAVFVDSGNGAGSFTFTPDFTQADTYYVTFIATDIVGEADSEVVEIAVTEFGNHAPDLDSIGPKTVVEGDTLEFRIHATDLDLDSIILSVENPPTNSVFMDSGNGGGSFTFTPDFTQADTYYVTFIATDTVGDADSEVVEIVVTEFGNHAPELDSIGPKTVVEGDTLEFRLHATDLDLDSLILSAEDLPTNSVIVDSGNGAGSFTFTPDFTQADTYYVTFIATDIVGEADSEVVEIVVTEAGNQAPELDSIGPKTVMEGDTLEFRIHATDLDLDSIILSVVNPPTNSVFMDSGNGGGSFTFTPDFTQADTYYVTFIATDVGGAADSEVVEIVVTEFGNHSPELDSIGPQTVVEGDSLEFRIHARDSDLDSIILSAENLPTNSVFMDSGNGSGSFTFTPDFTQADTYYVTFIATDIVGEADSEVVEIVVTEFGNHAPELDSIGPKTVVEGNTLEFRLHATDLDLDSLILSAEDLPANSVIVDSGNGAGSFTFTPDFTQADTYYVTFIATDIVGDADSEVVEIVVTEFGNHAPELDSIGPQTVVEGDTLEFRIHATDSDLDSIILKAENQPTNSVFMDSGNGAGSFTFTPDFTQADTYYVTFIATDMVGEADSEVIEIVVTEAGNQAPELDSIGPQEVVEGDTLEFRIHATDVDGDLIILDTLDVPLNATFVDSGNGAGSFTFTPDFTQADTYYVTFIATDTVGAADSEVVEIAVTEFGNHAPELDSIGPKMVMEGDTLEFRVHATDEDLDSIILSGEDLPTNSVIVDSGNGAGSFTFTPDSTQADTYYVTFIAKDISLADTEIVTITVVEWQNRPPVLDSIGPQAVFEGDSLIFTVTASDSDGTVPILDVSNLPDNATFEDSGNGHGLFTFYPDFYQAGIETVTFTAIDMSFPPPLSDFENVEITIVEINQPPQIDSIGPQNVQAGTTLEIRVVGTDPTDPDGGPLYMTAVGLPENSTFEDSGGGVAGFIFTPDYSQVGVDTITFFCTDEGIPPMSGFEEVVITVTEGANRPPVLDTIGYQIVTEADTLQFRVHATDPDGTIPILYTSLPLPRNAEFIDSANGAGSFTFTPDYAQSGLCEVTFYASDGDLDDYEQVIIQVIEAGNQWPVLDSIGPQIVTEGETLIVIVSAVDPDSTIPALDVDTLPIGATFTDSLNGTGVFEFYPAYFQSGVYYLTFSASDEELADSETVEITVIEAGNQSPDLDSIGPKEVKEREWLGFPVTASDPDSTIPTLRARDMPPSASFTDNGDGTGSFLYRPSFWEQGVYYTIFEALDSEDTTLVDAEVVEITVIDSNQHPEVAVDPDLSVFQVDEGDSIMFLIIGTDPDSVIPSVHVGSMPENATLEDSGNGIGVFVFRPDYTQGAFPPVDYSVYPYVIDGWYPEDTVWSLTRTLRVWDVPEPPVIEPMNDTSVAEGNTLNLHVVTNSIADIPALQAVNQPDNSTFDDSGNGRGGFKFTPDYTQGNSVYEVSFIAQSRGLADTEMVQITVIEVGQAPVLDSIGPKSVMEGDTLEFRIHATDPDGDSIILAVLENPPNSFLVDSGNGAGSFTFTPNFFQAHTYNVSFYAWDTLWLNDMEQVEIVVLNVNRPPVLDSIEPKSVMEGETLEFRIHATDPDLDSIILDTTNVPLNATFIDSGNGSGSFTFTPDFNQADIYYVDFIAKDTLGGEDSGEVEIVVIEAGNQPPVLDSLIDSVGVAVGDTLILHIHATDPDGPSLTLSTDILPTNSDFHDSGNGGGLFRFYPVSTQEDSIYHVTFIVSDGLLADSQMVTMRVYSYIPGDVNGDGAVNSADIVFLIDYLFREGPSPPVLNAADPTGDCDINSSDIVYLTDYLFKGGPSPRFGCVEKKE